ncbi:glycosyltransferase [Flavobacterium supellecticarium]|uniref:Glycosyltransferase n=1 Tax=Flavobacterium supellecticarium TaxID=2565924 RepID=A0A4S4A089_9FLAO|nr:glycosyltransferase [Flavobacterium supellecticarium]THF51607.1 glycosyltransferase [Flavobacterium supellecticarium]
MKHYRSQEEILADWSGQDIHKPLVSILCDTFKHEAYLSDALEGFLSQKTNFPFEIIVHEDASPDGTPALLKEFESRYPLLIKPIYQKENQFSKIGTRGIWGETTFPRARGKYIALCEGDDYWIDPYKLQKQVDFLETNPDYVITWTNYWNKKGEELWSNDFTETLPPIHTIDFDNLFVPYCTLTLTSLFRRSAVNPQDFTNFQYVKDNTLYGLVLCHGKGAFLNFQGGVYRWHMGGIYSLKPAFFQRYSSYLNVKEIYDRLPQAQTSNMQKVIQSLLKDSAFEALKLYRDKEAYAKEPQQAVQLFLKQASFGMRMKFWRRHIKMNYFGIKYN